MNKNCIDCEVMDASNKTDAQHLASYDWRCSLLRDRVISVAEGYHNALLVKGRPGTGKTHHILNALDEMHAAYNYQSGRMSAVGLYDVFAQHQCDIIVIDDMALLLQDRAALQVFLPALGGKPGTPRQITCSMRKQGERPNAITFSGGVIAISNTALPRNAMTDALASRSTLLEHEPSEKEIAAVIRRMAGKGYKDITAKECQDVAECIIDECNKAEYPLDLRCWLKALQDYRQYHDKKSICHWTDLIRSSMREIMAAQAVQVPSKADQHRAELEKVRAVMQEHPDDSTKLQIKKSGLKKTKFYELRRELEQLKQAS